MAMSFGDKVELPALVIAVDYNQIQNMRIIMDREMFDNYIEELGSLVTEEQKKHLEYELFAQTDMNTIIKRKNNTSYVTGLSKDAEISSRSYDEIDSYNHTVHT